MSKPLIFECDCNRADFTNGEVIRINDDECYDIDNGCIYSFEYNDTDFIWDIEYAIMQSGNVYEVVWYYVECESESGCEIVTDYRLGKHLGSIPVNADNIKFWHCIRDIIIKETE